MKVSHSKLSCILSCPMTYYLQYIVGIQPKEEKPALSIGSAVHYGLEHNSNDLSQYFIDNWNWNKLNPYTREQVLAESMVYGFLTKKEKFFKDILYDEATNSYAELVDEEHELFLTGKLKSFAFDKPHDFVGIIDLLLITTKGIIILDYKTSSNDPNWNDYLEQIYRYIFLVKDNFPELPIYKIGIINLKKSKTRWQNGEAQTSYENRLKREYQFDDSLVSYHIFEPSNLNQHFIDEYLLNLSRQCDAAESIINSNAFFINYGNVIGKYGKSQYYDIFYQTKSCHVLYRISDYIYDVDNDTFLTTRDCKDIDMKVIDHINVLNKYEQFKISALQYYSITNDIDKDKLFKTLKQRYIVDDELLELYWNTLLKELQDNQKDI